MKKFRNITVSVLMIGLMMALILPFSVYANGPAPSPELCFYVHNLPEGTANVDLAVLAPADEMVDLAQEPPEGVKADSPLARGQYGKFVSYSFRVRYAKSTIVPDERNCVLFGHAGAIPGWGQIRLIMADRNGEVLKISDSFRITPRNLFDYSLNTFDYDAATDTLEMETAHSSLAFILYVLVSLAGLVLTCFCEWLVGGAFKLTAVHGKLIIIVNVVSQIVMRVLFVILYSMIPQYWLIMMLLELLVYAGEFVAYCRIAWYMPTRKWLVYVLTANTVSLIVGAVLNLMIL